ncbi:MAG: metallophosphoesterase [Cyclobacteriaceae bacterium]
MWSYFYKTAFIVMLFFATSCVQQQTFTFVQLCDTQLGMGGYQHDVQSFEQAVDQINQLKPDFAVICGDLVHHASDSSYTDFKRIMRGLKVPCHLAPGNHDVGNTPTDTTLAYYRKVIGDDYFTFENKGYSFVVTNTQLWKVDVENESDKHHNWFKSTLDSLSNLKRPQFVIGHYPIYIKSPDEEEKYFNLPLSNRKEILSLLKFHGVKAYLSGHKHETIINDYEGISMVSGETTSKNFDKRPLGFRLWEVSSDSISHQFIPLIDR